MSDGVHFTEFPSWEQMDFSRNCTMWGDWLSIYLTPNPNINNVVIGPATDAGLQLFRASLPGNESDQLALLGNMTLSEAFQKISAWYVFNIYNSWNGSADYTSGHWETNTNFTMNVVLAPIENCKVEFCQATAIVANPDVTGIGVWTSYLIEGILTTLYLIAFTAWHIRRHYQAKSAEKKQGAPLVHNHKKATGMRAKLAELGLAQRTLDAFRGSLDGFLSAAMLLSLAMICSSLYLTIHAIEEPALGTNFGISVDGTSSFNFPTHNSALYDMLLSYLASCYSVFPVMLLYALKGRRSSIKKPARGKGGKAVMDGEQHGGKLEDSTSARVRRAFMVIIWILGVVLTFLSPRGNPDFHTHEDLTSLTTDANFCNVRGGTSYWQATTFAEGAVIVLPVLWILVTTFLNTGFGIPGVVNNRWIRRWRGIWRLGVAWVNWIILWSVLGIFAVARTRIRDLAGNSDQQNTWGFGQVLALVTWTPTVGEWVYIFIFGIEDNLDSHLPSGFEVNRVNSGMLQEEVDTIGPDPFEMDQDHVVGDEKRATSSATASDSMVRTRGHGATNDHVTTIEEQHPLNTHSGNNAGQQTETPSEHLNSAGW